MMREAHDPVQRFNGDPCAPFLGQQLGNREAGEKVVHRAGEAHCSRTRAQGGPDHRSIELKLNGHVHENSLSVHTPAPDSAEQVASEPCLLSLIQPLSSNLTGTVNSGQYPNHLRIGANTLPVFGIHRASHSKSRPAEAALRPSLRASVNAAWGRGGESLSAEVAAKIGNSAHIQPQPLE